MGWWRRRWIVVVAAGLLLVVDWVLVPGWERVCPSDAAAHKRLPSPSSPISLYSIQRTRQPTDSLLGLVAVSN